MTVEALGKRMGSAVYLHASIAVNVIPWPVMGPALDAIGDWPWTVAKWDTKTSAVTFVQSPDWDAAHEPQVGESILVKPDGKTKRRPAAADPEIYHHKWQFVGPGYDGFDLEASRRRSASWEALGDVDRKRIGKRSYWEEHVVPRIDGPARAASAGVVPQDYEVVDVETLALHPDNPRRGDLATIQESVESNGFYGAIVAQKSTRRILAGNHRWRAARSAGLTEVPVIWIDVDDDEARRILLVDNGANDRAGYDDAALRGLLERAKDRGGLRGTGYRESDLQGLIKRAQHVNNVAGQSDPKAILQRFEERDRQAVERLAGFGTSIARTEVSAPVRFYQEAGLLEGEVLDYGAGRDPHEYARYDPAYFPDLELLARRWDVVMCNFVLNVIPLDHNRVELLTTLQALSTRRVLVSVWTKAEEESASRAGYQAGLTADDWHAFVVKFAPRAERLASANFIGWRIDA